ncbi:MAG: ATP-dependent protease ATPase subunit HslU, partial [Firmicutes bacterium]|nr:ATP-dependent protease ATPase subunit HslU [Bacillota bacterium]
KFTEVGYVGRDVDAMVRDLVESSVRMAKEERMGEVEDRAESLAEDRIIDILAPFPQADSNFKNPFEAFFSGGTTPHAESHVSSEERRAIEEKRQLLRKKLREHQMEKDLIEVELEDAAPVMPMFSGMPGAEENQNNMGEMLSNLLPKRTKRRKMTIAEARKALTQEEAQKLIDADAVNADAIWRAEQLGIIFIDEFDKIASASTEGRGPDVSREGVQRDILPIVEGSTVNTKYGAVRTDHILFIAAGAFHVAKPSDLIPELQGRFPIRVELKALTEADFFRILTEPKNSLIAQYQALLSTEGVELVFEEDGLKEIARFAAQINQDTENIGARRLHTILEKVLEELNFSAPELQGQTIRVTDVYVQQRLAGIADNIDTNRYIL